MCKVERELQKINHFCFLDLHVLSRLRLTIYQHFSYYEVYFIQYFCKTTVYGINDLINVNFTRFFAIEDGI